MSAWCHETGTFRLRETTPKENPGPQVLGVGRKAINLPSKKILAAKSQVCIASRLDGYSNDDYENAKGK